MIKQIAAIHTAAVLGYRIKQEFPEVAEEYRRGSTLAEITGELCLDIVYQVNFVTAREALRKALTGYSGEIQKFPKKYSGLIESKEEQKKLAYEHRLFRKNSLAGIIARGNAPWIKRREIEDFCLVSEIEFAYMLSELEEFQKHNKPDLKKIAEELNKRYHDKRKIRTSEAVCSRLARFKNLKN